MPRPPAALPRPEALPPREGLAGRIAFATNARSIPLPAVLSRPMPAAAHLNGAFVTGLGRKPPGRKCSSCWRGRPAERWTSCSTPASAGGSTSASEGLPAFASHRSLRPGCDGVLSFEDATGDRSRIALGGSGPVVVAITRPSLQGRPEGTGRDSREAANPRTQAVLNRLAPP
jgi:hypothetical protein